MGYKDLPVLVYLFLQPPFLPPLYSSIQMNYRQCLQTATFSVPHDLVHSLYFGMFFPFVSRCLTSTYFFGTQLSSIGKPSLTPSTPFMPLGTPLSLAWISFKHLLYIILIIALFMLHFINCEDIKKIGMS